MHFPHSLAIVLVLVKVVLCKDVQEEEPEEKVESRQLELGGRQLVRFGDTPLAKMIMGPMEGVRKMAAQTTWGLLKTLDPDGSRAGPARVRRPQRQRGGQRPRGGPQQGRIAITQEEYDYLNNFDDDLNHFDYDEDLSFDYYDYSADGETNNGFLIEPVPVAPNLPVRNNKINRNKNNFGNPRRRPNQQKTASFPGPKQFNRPQIINGLIEEIKRSGFDGPYYPYPTHVGKK